MTDKIEIDIKVTAEVQHVYPIKVTPEQAQALENNTLPGNDLRTLLDDNISNRYWLDEDDHEEIVRNSQWEIMEIDPV